MRLESLHPEVSVQEVIERTGFELTIPEHVSVTDPPGESELAPLRSLDPDRRLL